MGILGLIAAILFLLFIQWSRINKSEKNENVKQMEKMEKDILKNLIENQNLNYELIEESSDGYCYKMVFQTEKGNFDVVDTLQKQEPHYVALYTYFPSEIPKGNRLKVSEFLTYLNYGLHIGNFEMNMSNGKLRVKVSFCYDNSGTMTDYLFDLYLKNSYRLLECYFDGIMTVIYSDKTSQNVYEELTNQLYVSLN
jgi:hypothetical protein